MGGWRPAARAFPARWTEVGEAVVVDAQGEELLAVKFAFDGDEHFQATRTGQAVEVVNPHEAQVENNFIKLNDFKDQKMTLMEGLHLARKPTFGGA